MEIGLVTMAGACRGMIHRLDSTVNNIANVDTAGFKTEQLFFFNDAPGVTPTGEPLMPRPTSLIDYSPGELYKTGNDFDLALGGTGFFAIQTEAGTAYTRDGRFALNRKKELVTLSGNHVLGRSGKIVIAGDDMEVGGQGDIMVDGRRAAKLMIVDFEDEARLVRDEGGIFRDPERLAGMKGTDNPGVQQGYLEHSNVQAVREMVKMIDIQRSFEAYQKIVQTLQDQDKLSTNRVGKL